MELKRILMNQDRDVKNRNLNIRLNQSELTLLNDLADKYECRISTMARALLLNIAYQELNRLKAEGFTEVDKEYRSMLIRSERGDK